MDAPDYITKLSNDINEVSRALDRVPSHRPLGSTASSIAATPTSVESAERAAHDIVTACASMREALALSQSHHEFMAVWSLVRASWNQIEGVARYAGGAANERE